MIFSNTSVLISGKVAEPSLDSAKEPGNVVQELEKKKERHFVSVAVGKLGPDSVCVGGGGGEEVLGVLEQWSWIYQAHTMHGGLWHSTPRRSPCFGCGLLGLGSDGKPVE